MEPIKFEFKWDYRSNWEVGKVVNNIEVILTSTRYFFDEMYKPGEALRIRVGIKYPDGTTYNRNYHIPNHRQKFAEKAVVAPNATTGKLLRVELARLWGRLIVTIEEAEGDLTYQDEV